MFSTVKELQSHLETVQEEIGKVGEAGVRIHLYDLLDSKYVQTKEMKTFTDFKEDLFFGVVKTKEGTAVIPYGYSYDGIDHRIVLYVDQAHLITEEDQNRINHAIERIKKKIASLQNESKKLRSILK